MNWNAELLRNLIKKTGTTKETASVHATEVIEIVKAYHGDLSKAADKLGDSTADAGSLTKEYTDDGMKVVLETDDTAQSDMYQKAKVSVSEIPKEGEEQKEPVYTVDVAWQTQEQLLK